jgi:hypothetical protein
VRYELGWDAGPTAEIELRMPQSGGNFGLRYNSPYRSTLRPPPEPLRVGLASLQPSTKALQSLVSSLQLVRGRGPGLGGGGGVQAADSLKKIGRDLYDYMLPGHVKSDLRDPIFIELAIDEEMLVYPWELMHDGEEFLGKRHALGRYVNLAQPLYEQSSRGQGFSTELTELKILVIGVPRPQTGGEVTELTAVKPEVEAITETLNAIGIQPTLLLARDATYEAVREELRREYHIIHFSGHATFDDQSPNRSALLLFDQPIETGAIMASFSQHPAVLCFINGCEATRTASGEAGGAAPDTPGVDGGDGGAVEEWTWENQYNNYGLARAFLETGSYLLGSRWRLEDDAAQIFARAFYEAALGQGEPIGQAITMARVRTANESSPDSCAWASYVYYGDPRMIFRPETPVSFSVPVAAPEPDVLQVLRDLARQYEQTRAAVPSGWSRTAEMTRIAQEAAAAAGSVDLGAGVQTLFAESEGGRVIALAIVRDRPDPSYFDLVMDGIMKSRSAFEQYVALEAMRGMSTLLDPQRTGILREAISQLSEKEDFFGTDRYAIANQIASQLSGTAGVALA